MPPCPATDLLSAIDTACPAWVELCAPRPGSYSTAFAICTGNETVLILSNTCQELIEETDAAGVIEASFSPRLSSAEKMRRMIGYVLTFPDQANARPDLLSSFAEKQHHQTAMFLKREAPSFTEKDSVSVIKSCFVARAISDRHWIEEWVTLSKRGVCFFHPGKRKASYRLLLSNLRQVISAPLQLCPNFPNHHFLEIKTSGRSVYLMFSTGKERDAFCDTFRRLKVMMTAEQSNDSISSLETNLFLPLLEMENPADEYLHRSTMWSCKNRRILNCGAFVLRQSNTSKNPLAMVEEALRLSLQSGDETLDDNEHRSSFLHSTAMLKAANIQALSENARLVFFLNLYHVMINHAYLALGPPDSSLKWISYFNSVAYQVSDDIFSIAELEHCIIRARMTYPSQFLSRFILPKSRYQMALKKADYRINFALNCGSISCPSKVPVYHEETLDRQLDTASTLYLECVTIVQQSTNEIVVQLPRVCQWFSEDFGSCPENLLEKVEPYLTGHHRKLLTNLRPLPSRRFVMDAISIRYHPFSFECRPLTLLS